MKTETREYYRIARDNLEKAIRRVRNANDELSDACSQEKEARAYLAKTKRFVTALQKDKP